MEVNSNTYFQDYDLNIKKNVITKKVHVLKTYILIL